MRQNEEFLIIDAHVHTYPTIEIGRQAVGPSGYGYFGTISEIKDVMKKANISHSIMASYIPVKEMKDANLSKIPADLAPDKRKEAVAEVNKKLVERVERRNQWTCNAAKENANLSALVFVDVLQSSEEMVKELEDKVVTMGAKGLKLHPMAGDYFPWDERMLPVYSRAQELGIAILFHAGVAEFPGYDVEYARPSQFEKVAKAFRELPIVIAHIGRGFYEESVEVAKKCPNIFFDTSTCFFEYESPSMKLVERFFDVNIIRKIGSHRILFGTDWPWFDPLRDIATIRSMKLSYEEKSKILGLNAKEVYRI